LSRLSWWCAHDRVNKRNTGETANSFYLKYSIDIEFDSHCYNTDA